MTFILKIYCENNYYLCIILFKERHFVTGCEIRRQVLLLSPLILLLLSVRENESLKIYRLDFLTKKDVRIHKQLPFSFLQGPYFSVGSISSSNIE